ncbi:hypothetical protein PQO03_14645 [Lentisphaera profundi]|uniref:Squalene cyclase C-terminal domain-containing protein n=1 Tax=Lentisphaera profundi TaxID=1658616 RepID=A0ABY7W4A3_9BACT|nr:hypothetical protein [Lentisphaera profundi]WDE99073.1 hypothetical protein PQO03_14645 [Lentisphaera profundi]
MSEQKHPEDLYRFMNSEELLELQAHYQRQQLKENLIGPVISTCMHVLLIFAATFYKSEPRQINPKVEVTRTIDRVLKEPEPIPIPKKLEVPEIENDLIENLELPVATDIEAFLPVLREDFAGPPSVEIMEKAEGIEPMKPSTSSVQSETMSKRRSFKDRLNAMQKYKATEASQESLLRGLDWLAKNQSPNGSWGGSGVTGLALLAFLAHGETPKSQRYGKTVSKAIKWTCSESPGANLISPSKLDTKTRRVGIEQVSKEVLGFYAGGPVAGTGDVAISHGYPHAIKVYALAEAYTMTDNYSIVAPLKAFAKILINGQKEEGDFDYNYKQGPRWDNSISFWNYQALKALKSTKLDIEGLDQAIERAIPRMKLMAKFQFPYSGTSTPRSGRGNAGLAAAGALCLQLLGAAKGDSHVDKIMDRIHEEGLVHLDWVNAPKKWVMYAWYYQTFAMFQHGGKHWRDWNAKFQKVLMKNQHLEGYWAHELAWSGGKGTQGKAYQTAMASLMLTVYYRYSPPSAEKKSAVKPGKLEKNTGMEDETIDIF